MARFARVMAVEVPHHVTQRGNARAFILDCDADRQVYLELLREHAALHHLSMVGYCLMSNHVHLVAVPHRAAALPLTCKQTHGRYASYWNARHGSSGHVWQGRYYSCPLDEPHLWAALRYAEQNPVRAGLVADAGSWPWSSAAAHCTGLSDDPLLDMEFWRKRWTPSEWRAYLTRPQEETEIHELQHCTHTGRPLGSADFVKALEQNTRRQLAPRNGGRPARRLANELQKVLEFDK